MSIPHSHFEAASRPSARGRTAVGLLIASAAASSCTVGPRYQPPEISLAPRYAETGLPHDQAPLSQPLSTEADVSQWWLQFHDDKLQTLVQRAREGNLDLQSAASRIREAREQEIIAGAARLPSLNAIGLGARLHANSNPLANLGGTNSAAASSQSTALELYSAGFDATWELDVFGRAARNREAAQAETAAAVWQLRDAQVSLSAEIANDYLSLRTTQLLIAIARSAVERQRQMLRIVEARSRAGFVTQLDVNQQRAELASTAAQLPALESQERGMQHALAVLLGQQPDTLIEELAVTDAQLPSVPQMLPAGLPSDLLRRRPDVRSAERQLAAATAKVGVATADLYPKFNLIGAASFASSSIGSLLSSRNFSTVAAGLISWPVFQGGKVRANIHATQEQRMQAYLAYQKAVLVALQNAEDGIERYTSEQRRLLSLREAEQAAHSSLTIAEAQYRAGTINFQSVLTASTVDLNAQQQVAQSTQMLAQNLVALYKSLGGGWTP